MNKINTFDELYKTSISIIENKNNSYENYSVTEIINFIRLNSEKFEKISKKYSEAQTSYQKGIISAQDFMKISL